VQKAAATGRRSGSEAGGKGRRNRTLLIAAAAGFATILVFGIIITIRKGGKTTTLDVPPGSTVVVSPEGDVDVTLPEAGPDDTSGELPPGPSANILPGLVPRPARLPDVGRWQLLTLEPRGMMAGLDFSSDGKRIACGEGALVRVYEVPSARLVQVFLHTDPVTAVSFQPGGAWLAAAGGRTVRTWNMSNGKAGPSMEHPQNVACAAWSPDGTRLVTGSADRLVRIFRADGKAGPVLGGHQGEISSVCWSSDSKRLASASLADKTVRIWSDDGKPGPVLDAAQGASRVAWSPDGKRLAASTYRATQEPIRLWNTSSWKLERSLAGSSDPDGVQCLAWGPDSRRLVFVRDDGRMRLWDVEQSSATEIPGLVGSPAWVAWSRQGSWIAFLLDLGSLQLWDPVNKAKGPELGTANMNLAQVEVAAKDQCVATRVFNQNEVRLWTGEGRPGPVLRGHAQAVFTFAFSPDGRTLASGSMDRTVRLWSVPDGRPGLILKGHSMGVRCLAWSPDGRILVSGSDDRTLRIWDAARGECLKVLGDLVGPVRELVWSPNGRQFASVTPDMSGTAKAGDADLRLWTADGQPGPTIKGSWTQGISWSRDGQRIAAAVFKDVRVWNVSDGSPGPALPGSRGDATCTAWKAGEWLYAGYRPAGSGGGVRFWPIGGSREMRPLTAHCVDRIAWSPDWNWLAAIDRDPPEIRLWDFAGKPGPSRQYPYPASLPRLPNVASWLAWGSDSRTLFSVGRDGVLRRWDVQAGQLLSASLVFSEGRAAYVTTGGTVEITDPAVERELVYIVEDPDKTLKLLPPAEFRKLLKPPQARQAMRKSSGFRVHGSAEAPQPGVSGPASSPRPLAGEGPGVRVPSPYLGPDGNWRLPPGAPPPAVAPFDAKKAKEHQEAWAKYLGVPVEMTNSIGMKLVLIPPGEFDIGSSEAEVAKLQEKGKARKEYEGYLSLLAAESPRHRVRITRPFYLGQCEVTQAQYQDVTGVNPSGFTENQMEGSKFNPPLLERDVQNLARLRERVAGLDTSRHPVEMVSWSDASAFCLRLGERPQEQAAHAAYRLPTEAEWEYACRAGTTTAWHGTDDEIALREQAWFGVNSGGRTNPVGQKAPNAWRLYDMHGNVSESCQDGWNERYYAVSPANDPMAMPKDHLRVGRGSGFGANSAGECRSSARGYDGAGNRRSNTGFRIVCEIPRKAEIAKPNAEGGRLQPVPLDIKPDPKLIEFKPGEPLSTIALVTEPTPISRLRSWSLDTIGHRSAVWAVAFCPDGQTLATAGADGTIRVWEIPGGQLKRVLLRAASEIHSLSWSPDGKYLAAGGGVLPRVWDARSGLLVAELPTSYCAVVAWSPDGRYLAVSGVFGGVYLLDAPSFTPRWPAQGQAGSSVWRLAWSADGKRFASGSGDGSVIVWGIEAPERSPPLRLPGLPGPAIAWSPTGAVLATYNSQTAGDVQFWNVDKAQPVDSLPRPPLGRANSLAWSPDGKTLAAAAENQTDGICLWDVASRKLTRISGLRHGVGYLAWSPDSKMVAFGGTDGCSWFHRPESGQTTLVGREGRTRASWPVFSPDGQIVAYNAGNGSVGLWRIASCDLPRELTGKFKEDWDSFAWSENGNLLAGRRSDTVSFWDLRSGRQLSRLDLPKGSCPQMAVSPDGKAIATGGDEISLRDVPNGKLLRKFPLAGHPWSWSPDGTLLLAYVQKKWVLCDAESGAVRQTLAELSAPDPIVAWSPDVAKLATAGGEGKARVWNVSSGRLMQSVENGVFQAPKQLRWCNDGKMIVAADMASVLVWDTESGKIVRETRLHQKSQHRDVSPNGRLVSSCNGNTIRLERVEDGSIQGTLVSLQSSRTVVVNPNGHYVGSPGVEEDLVYVIQTDNGQETLAPEEFAKKYGWKNEAQKALRAVEAAVAPPAKPKTEPGVPSPVPSAK
jgi:WD40 repeat protein/formylglycine-generating enzyme required for sulfatase activity